MFAGDEVLLEVSFAVACERLTRLTESGALITTSEDSYSRESGALTRVGAIGLSRLVRVQVRELPGTERSAGIALRWEAVGPGGGLFPVLERRMWRMSVAAARRNRRMIFDTPQRLATSVVEDH